MRSFHKAPCVVPETIIHVKNFCF